jgi:hypothetical protein
MTFQPGLMNRALSNREMFRQVQTMPVTANDPRPRRSQELMDYVSEGTEGQWKDPDKRPTEKPKSRNQERAEAGEAEGRRRLAEKKAAKTRPSAKSLAPKSPGEQTETGKQIKGALSGIGQGLAALFSEKPSAPQQERPVLPMQTRDVSAHGVSANQEILPGNDDYVEKGTHGQNWDLIRLGMDAQEQDWHGKSKGKPQKPAAGDSTWRDWSAGRSQGSRGHFDAGHT